MVPARPTFWNIPPWSEALQYVLGLAVVVFIVWAVTRYIFTWRRGAPEPRPHLSLAVIAAMLRQFVRHILFPQRLAKDPYAFITHTGLLWGMLILALGTAIATIDWDVFHLFFGIRLLSGTFYRLFELVLDLAGAALLLGILLAVVRRYGLRPGRLTSPTNTRDRWQSASILALLFLIAITGFLVEGLRIKAGCMLQETITSQAGREASPHESDLAAATAASIAAWTPIGRLVGGAFQGASLAMIRRLHLIFWWIHALAAFAFLFAIPLTKANHLIAAFLNVVLPRTEGLPSAVNNTASAPLTRRQRLEVSGCTACGKCQEACPAHSSGYPLTPKGVVWAMQGQLIREVWPSWIFFHPSADEKSFLENEVFWSCYTCRACEEVCPTLIRHTGLMVSFRRSMVDQGQLADGLQDVLMNLQRYGNSFGQSPRKRADWTKTLPFTIKNAAKEPVEFLWFVGDYMSYDPRARLVAQDVARILRAAEVDFGILYDKEKNAGNDVRRIGEEGLFLSLRDDNSLALQGSQWKWIITSDPHSFHVLRNEYALASPSGKASDSQTLAPTMQASPEACSEQPQLASSGHSSPHLGNGRPLVRHTCELFWEFLRLGRLRVQKTIDRSVTYHDPCYLGRYNGIYEAPRAILEAIGCKVTEMPRHHSESYCCGAGGGRIWMKDRPGIQERPAEARIREALSLPHVQDLVVACPKDLVMFQDAIKALGADERLRVVDLATLLAEAVGINAEQQIHST
ncbi:MAG: heterodisulfide reductase-related iron-sulfur binding cluster [Thermogutta sp.]